jgi:sarcosine oxidase subunit beta
VADVLVVGAGIVGAASAYRLAEAGLKVLLLEKEATFAQGSTGRSAAGVRVQFSEPLNVLLSYHSILEYQRIPEAGYRPIGYLFLVPEALAEAQEEALRTQKALGVPVERLSLEEAREKVPFLEEGLAFATFGPMDGVIDPHGATAFYLKEARRLGAEVRFSEPLLFAERQGGLWRVETPKGRYEAPFLLLSTGAWTGEVGRRLGVEIPIWPVRRVVYATAPAPFPHAFPLTIDLGTGFYLRSEGERLLFGRSNPEEPPGFTEGVDWAWLGPTLEGASPASPSSRSSPWTGGPAGGATTRSPRTTTPSWASWPRGFLWRRASPGTGCSRRPWWAASWRRRSSWGGREAWTSRLLAWSAS